jgi:spermidine synthase
MVFPLTFRLASGGAVGGRVGRLLAANTVGGILGSTGASYVLLPAVGLFSSIGWLGALYGIAALAVPGSLRARVGALALLCATVLTLRGLAQDPWSVPSVTLRAGETLVAFEEGAAGLVSVVEDSDGNRRIKIDDTYQFGDSKEARLSERLGHLPLLLHPEPKSVAFVGSATGGVACAAVQHPVQRIDLIEIVPEVQELAARHFAHVNRGVHHEPRTRRITEDGRNHLRATRERYDVIVEDCFVPYHPSAASMYTQDHYAEARERLSERGVFCQWLPVYQLEAQTLAIIVATFLEEFPAGALWRPHLRPHFPVLGLLGCRGPWPSVAELTQRSSELRALGVEDPWVCDARGLWMLYLGPADQWFAGEPRPRPHRDRTPYFEFIASRYSPLDVARYPYSGWVRMNDRLLGGSSEGDPLFPGRPRSPLLGAQALLRANLAWAGGARDKAGEAWREAEKHLPAELLVLGDKTFSDVWPRDSRPR